MEDHSTWWVAMDWHAERIQVAGLKDWQDEYVEWEVGGDSKGHVQLLRRLKGLKGKVRCVYEAGPGGYVLYRWLSDHGIECMVAAPSLIPKKSGDRVKTNRRDARKLANLFRGKQLTAVVVPDVKQEALRDLTRARESVLDDVKRSKQRLLKLLLRYGHRYTEGRNWTRQHWVWLGRIRFDEPLTQRVFEEYRRSLDISLEQLERLTAELGEVAQQEPYRQRVARQAALRGVRWLTAITVLAEAGDLKRFTSAGSFMAATGMVSREGSTGTKERRGSITKTGNAHLRRVMIEAAWQYWRAARGRQAALKRRQGQSPAVLDIVRRAEVRLHRKFHRLVNRGKPSEVAVVAVARELTGFMWALEQIQEPAA